MEGNPNLISYFRLLIRIMASTIKNFTEELTMVWQLIRSCPLYLVCTMASTDGGNPNLILYFRLRIMASTIKNFTEELKMVSQVIRGHHQVRHHALASEAANLPHDVILDILSRLPARTLGRLRCVCKLWNSLFHDSRFVRQQLNHASKNPTTFFGYKCLDHYEKFSFYSFKIKASKVVIYDMFTVPVKTHCLYRTSNPCNGLVALYADSFAYVVNPCTREWVALPKGSPHNPSRRIMDIAETMEPFLGLGFSPTIGKYKLVRFFFRDDFRWACEVFTLGTDHSWRLLGEMLYAVTSFEPAYANGHIYWTINDNYTNEYYMGSEGVLAFDVCKEKFTTIKFPQFRPVPDATYHHLCMRTLQWSACLVDWRVHLDKPRRRFLPEMHIYVLKGHEWTESHSLMLEAFPNYKSHWDASFLSMFPLTIEDSKVLLHHRNGNWKHHDLQTGTCSMIKLPSLKYMPYHAFPFVCAESIVSLDGLNN